MQALKLHYNKLSYRERVLVFAASCVCGVVLLKILVLDRVQDIYRLSTDSHRIRHEIRQQESQLEALQKQKGGQRREAKFDATLAANTGQRQLFRAIANIDQRWEHFELKRVTNQKTELKGTQEVTTYELEVEAPFPSLAGFLGYLEKSDLLARVENISVFRIENELKLCQAKIRVVGYSWRDP